MPKVKRFVIKNEFNRLASGGGLTGAGKVGGRILGEQRVTFAATFFYGGLQVQPAPGIGFPLYAFVKRTRTTQKISKISGRMLRIKYKLVLNKAGERCRPSPTVESNLNGRFEGPRKKDPAAMNSPKHMRQRCRAMRFAPRTPPRASMRTSPAAASRHTEPMKKIIPTGTPSCELAPLRTTLTPVIQLRMPFARGISSATQSKRLVSPSLRLAVSHAVPIR